MKSYKRIIFIFLAFVFVKGILSLFVVTPTIYSDEYMYSKLAQSLATSFHYDVHNIPQNAYPPLYPLFLAPAYFFFTDMTLIYFLMKFINAFLSTLIIIPAYFLSREFIGSQESRNIAILVGFLPLSFSFTPYLMAENLFYTLALFAIYFIYKSELTSSTRYYALAGVFIGAAFLTKALGIVLCILVGLLFIKNVLKKEKVHWKKKFITAGIISLMLFPWILRNLLVFGFSFSSILGRAYTSELGNTTRQTLFSNLWNGALWSVIYIDILIFASGILFSLGFIRFMKQKNKNEQEQTFFLITLLFMFILLFIAVNHNLHGGFKEDNLLNLTGRPIARYTDVLLPLLIIGGYLGLQKQNLDKWKLPLSTKILLLLFLAIGSNLLFFPLLPVNNLSISFLGVVQLFLQFLGASLLITSLLFSLGIVFFTWFILSYLFKKYNLNTILIISLFGFLLLSLLNVSIVAYNSQKNWYSLEQVQLGKWVQNNIKPDKTLAFDEDGCTSRSVQDPLSICSPAKQTTLAGFWIYNDITIAKNPEMDTDYFISRKELPYIKVHTTESNINVYQVS